MKIALPLPAPASALSVGVALTVGLTLGAGLEAIPAMAGIGEPAAPAAHVGMRLPTGQGLPTAHPLPTVVMQAGRRVVPAEATGEGDGADGALKSAGPICCAAGIAATAQFPAGQEPLPSNSARPCALPFTLGGEP